MSLSTSPPTGRIDGLQFGLFSPDAFRRQSVVEVFTHELYDGDTPKDGGLFDPRMGVLDSHSVCPTDQRGQLDGPGYFGHIELARPVLGYQYIKWIVKVLRCVCPHCSYPRFNTADKKIREHLLAAEHAMRLKRALAYAEKKTKRNCERCGNLLPRTMRKDKSMFHCVCALYRIDGAEKSVMLLPEMIERIFKGITDDDCWFLGLDPKHARPEWMIFSVVPVPPPSMRPPVRKEGQLPMHDDITFKLCDILKANRALASYIDRPPKEGEDPAARANAENCYRRVLQYHVAVLSNNTVQGLPQAQQRSGRPLKCIQSRLKSKEGRVRGNLNGKRVDFSARSVITPDPNLAVDELGVPARIAKKLTFPQRVTKFNIDALRDIVRRGANEYPGCNKIEVTRKGRTQVYSMSVRALADNPEKRARHANGLRVGDVVHRHLIDGDVVLFNRQPSLHRMSMMAHRVRVLPFETFRLNVNVTSPYNADFDGDEMNMHVPQSVAAAVELGEIACVRRQIISPGTGKPVISLVQDSLLGMSKFLDGKTTVSREEAMDLLVWCPGFRAIPDGVRVFQGTNLLTNHSLPFLRSVAHARPYNVLQKKQAAKGGGPFKSTAKKIIQAVFNDMSPERTRDLLDTMNHVAMRYLLSQGFSVGLRDVLVDEALTQNMHKERERSKEQVLGIIRSVHDGTFKNSSSRSNEAEFERAVLEKLNDSFTQVCNSLTAIPADNRLMQMIRAGSKGSSFNFSQMVAMIGQQAIAGGRVAYGFTDRTLPHFHRHDDGIRARGFVSSAYIDGLCPTELFFHAMAGREGLIDTAVKSVTRDTRVLVREGRTGPPRTVRIGDWIDDHLARESGRVKHHGPAEANMESLRLSPNSAAQILSNDRNGVLGWHDLTAVTRHDPGEHIYRVRTRWGREVCVVASKSMLVWDENADEFVPRDTDKLAVGDRVPVAFRTPAPEPLLESVDLGEYFPRGEYIHGTDYQCAWKVREAYGGEGHRLPAGWWQTHQGKDFVLPYKTGSRFIRSYGRSRGEDLRPGCVYIYGAKRSNAHLPASFELDEDNGFFVGLYLADGNSCGDYVGFAQNHGPTRARVAAWFDRHGITHRTTVRGSTTIRGNCTLLVRFLDAFVGKGASGKRVPDAAFAAPEAFVRGLLDGYFSGDGHVSPNSIQAGSASRPLIQGIMRLLARMGIFASLSRVQPKASVACAEPKASHRIRVSSRYARRFAETIRLTHRDKQRGLDVLRSSTSLEKFSDRYVEKGDTILDRVESIERMEARSQSDWRKVYDVTVPDTLNFELFDGLCVRDTAETGYLQRRLVKAMEDVHVAEDGTVRNVKGGIVQMHYGGDGFDVTKLEKYRVPDWYMVLSEAAELVRCIPDDQEITVPFNLERLIMSIDGATDHGGNGTAKDVKIRTRDALLASIDDAGKTDRWLWDMHTNVAIHTAIYTFFDPRNKSFPRACRLRASMIGPLVNRVMDKIRMSRVMPGEAVGIIGAQSLGEPATQMSARGDTEVLVVRDGVLQCTAIGPLVDELLGRTCTGEAVAPCDGLRCVGVSASERVAWAPVTHVSRHPANGHMLSVTTRHGRSLDMTASHSFLVRRGNRIIPRPGSHLVIGDCLPVLGRLSRARGGVVMPSAPYALGHPFGRFLGAVLADGYSNDHTVSFCNTDANWVRDVATGFAATSGVDRHHAMRIRTAAPSTHTLGTQEITTVSLHVTVLARWVGRHFGHTARDKTIPAWVLGASDEFVAGLLQAYFDGDGSVCADPAHKRLCCHSVSATLVRMVALCLARFGIPSYIGEEAYSTPAGRAGTIYRLRIPISDAKQFATAIGLTHSTKRHTLERLVALPHAGDRRQVPGTAGVLESLRACVDDPSTRREITRIRRRGRGVTFAMLRRLRGKAATHGASASLLKEIDQALLADVWWDPIVAIRAYKTDEMVYDFTVDRALQSFMLGNGVFVHNTLNTFHSAGSGAKSNVIRGVPRLKEILGATDNMKARSVVVYPKDGQTMASESKITALRNKLTQSRLRDVLLRSEIAYEPRGAPGTNFNKVYDLLSDMTGDASSPTNKAASWILSFTFSSESLVRHGVNMFDVYQAISAHLAKAYGSDLGDLAIAFSDDMGVRDGIAVMRIVYSMRIKKDRADTEEDSSDQDDEAAKESDERNNNEDEDVLMVLQKMEADLVGGVNIGGVPGISGGNVRELKLALLSQKTRHAVLSTDNPRSDKQFVIDTVGSNLRTLLSTDDIDSTRTTSNDIQEVYAVLGIEAARNTIINEFNEVVESAKTFVNNHHVSLLADTMTRPGYIISVNRFGINKSSDYSITNCASFEKTPDTFIEAAVFGKKDEMKGVSGCVMFGQSIRIGTGMVDVQTQESQDRRSTTTTRAVAMEYNPLAWGGNIGLPFM